MYAGSVTTPECGARSVGPGWVTTARNSSPREGTVECVDIVGHVNAVEAAGMVSCDTADFCANIMPPELLGLKHEVSVRAAVDIAQKRCVHGSRICSEQPKPACSTSVCAAVVPSHLRRKSEESEEAEGPVDKKPALK